MNLTGKFGQDNFIYGLSGDDTLSAAPNSENSGDNVLFGGPGADTLYGGSGRDKLLGQNDDDELYGGSNVDSLYGGKGNDELIGGSGADSYWFAPGEGTDTVFAFNLLEGDRIGFNSGLDIPFNMGQVSVVSYRSSPTTTSDFGAAIKYGDEFLAKFPLVSVEDVEQGIARMA